MDGYLGAANGWLRRWNLAQDTNFVCFAVGASTVKASRGRMATISCLGPRRDS